MSTQNARWVDIGALDSIPLRGARVVKTPAGCIAVFRTARDEAFAIEDRCPHKNGPLSNGIVHDNAVTCPLHNWVISLETGKAQGADQGDVRKFALKIDNGRVLLDASVLKSERAA